MSINWRGVEAGGPKALVNVSSGLWDRVEKLGDVQMLRATAGALEPAYVKVLDALKAVTTSYRGYNDLVKSPAAFTRVGKSLMDELVRRIDRADLVISELERAVEAAVQGAKDD